MYAYPHISSVYDEWQCSLIDKRVYVIGLRILANEVVNSVDKIKLNCQIKLN